MRAEMMRPSDSTWSVRHWAEARRRSMGRPDTVHVLARDVGPKAAERLHQQHIASVLGTTVRRLRKDYPHLLACSRFSQQRSQVAR